MNIQERLSRKNNEDVIYIGEYVEKILNSEFGEILRAYINGAITRELKYDHKSADERFMLKADRTLGRCEAYTNVLYELERMVDDAQQLKIPVEEEEDIEE